MSAASAKPAVKEVTEVVDASPLVVPDATAAWRLNERAAAASFATADATHVTIALVSMTKRPLAFETWLLHHHLVRPYIKGQELASSSQLRGTAARRAQVVGVGRFYLRVEVTTTRGGGRRRDCGRCSNRDSIPPPPPLLSVARVRFMSSKDDVFCAGHERESEISGGCFEPGTRERKRGR